MTVRAHNASSFILCVPGHRGIDPILTCSPAFGGSGNWADEVEETYGEFA